MKTHDPNDRSFQIPAARVLIRGFVLSYMGIAAFVIQIGGI